MDKKVRKKSQADIELQYQRIQRAVNNMTRGDRWQRDAHLQQAKKSALASRGINPEMHENQLRQGKYKSWHRKVGTGRFAGSNG